MTYSIKLSQLLQIHNDDDDDDDDDDLLITAYASTNYTKVSLFFVTYQHLKWQRQDEKRVFEAHHEDS